MAWLVIVFRHNVDFSHFVLIHKCSIGPKPGTEKSWTLLAQPPAQRAHSCVCQG